MTIGERIKKRREELNMSVDQLALKLGKNRATIYRYESDEIEKLPVTVLEPLAKVLNTTPAYFLGLDEHEKNDEIGEISSEWSFFSRTMIKKAIERGVTPEEAIGIDDFKKESKRLNDEIKMLQEVIDSFTSKEVEYSNVDEIRSFLIKLRDCENKKILIDTFIDTIVIYSDKVEINLVDSSNFCAKVKHGSPPPILAKKILIKIVVDRQKFRD